MDCRACAALLSALLDDELDASDAAAARAHLRSCEACARRWRRLLQARESFRALSPEVPSDTWNRRVLQGMVGGPGRWGRLALAALAAALLIAVLSSLSLQRSAVRAPAWNPSAVPASSRLAGLEAGTKDLACSTRDPGGPRCGLESPCATRDSCGPPPGSGGL